MFCEKCGNKMETDSRACNTCGVAVAPVAPTKHNLPASWMILLAGIGDIIVAAVFIIIGLIEISAYGMEFSSLIWVIFGGVIAGNGVQNIIRRNNFEKISETRTSMITGVVILGIAMIYFVVTGSLSIFFIAIIIPDIIGMVGAQINHNYAKNFKRQ